MTPQDMRILRSLVAVAWADGKVEKPEAGVLEGLLKGFGATPDEEKEIRSYAGLKRSLKDVPLAELNDEDKEILLGNAAVISHVDGNQSPQEKQVLDDLIKLLGFTDEQAKKILEEAKDGHLQLGTRGLEDA
jgi:tellurite resistance protein